MRETQQSNRKKTRNQTGKSKGTAFVEMLGHLTLTSNAMAALIGAKIKCTDVCGEESAKARIAQKLNEMSMGRMMVTMTQTTRNVSQTPHELSPDNPRNAPEPKKGKTPATNP